MDVISLFEVIDHTSDVRDLFETIDKVLRPGGLCFLTAILSSGFDVQVLWEHADNIYPPDRLNVLSVKGFKLLVEKYGFECVEFSTPGILDLEIVRNALKTNEDLSISRFVREIIEGHESVQRSFQEFLQQNLLSSYGRILLRKKEK